MAPSINWATKVITVPTADLTLLSGSLYEYSINTFRLALKDLEDDEVGMPFLKTHEHTPPHTLAGVAYGREIQVINGYTVTFQDGQYGVNIIGGNSNVSDVLNRNQVSVNTANSAGLIQVDTGGTFSSADRTKLEWIHKISKNRMEVDIAAQQLVLYDDNGTTVLQRWNLACSGSESVQTSSGVQAKRSAPLL